MKQTWVTDDESPEMTTHFPLITPSGLSMGTTLKTYISRRVRARGLSLIRKSRVPNSHNSQHRQTSISAAAPAHHFNFHLQTSHSNILLWNSNTTVYVCVCVCVLPPTDENSSHASVLKSILEPSSCLSSLLPNPRDTSSTTRLRSANKFPRLPSRTRKYQTFISYALSQYQSA